jgi:hypothetical protein
MKTSLVTVLALLLSSTALADQMKKGEAAPKPVPKDEPPPLPKTPPDLKSLAFLAAAWNCNGAGKDPQRGAEYTYKSTWRNKWDLKKQWISATYEMKKSKTLPVGLKGVGWIGIDAAASKYVFFGANDGGGYLQLSAAGWSADGNTLAFEGAAGPSQVRFSFTKTSDKAMTVTLDVSQGGQWVKMQEDTCKR